MAISEAAGSALEAVDAGLLMAHVREFAKRVKLSGTPAELESFGYLEARMREYGFRTTLIEHDAYISLPGKAELKVDGQSLVCITHSMSAPTPKQGLHGKLVFVGEGEESDIVGKDVSGKILLVDGIATEEVADRASRAGALAHIHVSPTEHLYEMCISPVWGSPSQHTLGNLPTTAAATISRDDGARLRERCLAGEEVEAFLTTEVDTGWRKTPLLVAELNAPQGGADAPFVMLSGHHDTWHFGVMDNGTANATMLEVARLIASRRPTLRRGLRVCFWSGHSHGRYSGSAWYADEYWHELEQRCVAHVNVDSTGGVGASVLTNSGVTYELAGVAAEAVKAVSGQTHAGRRQGRAADQSFWGVGIPAMFGSVSHQPPGPVKMLTALGWWWHTPHDLLANIDEANLVRDTRLILKVVLNLLESPVLPLDYAAYAEALIAELSRIETALEERLDISVLTAKAFELKANAERLKQKAGVEAKAEACNRALMRVSRALVPLNYTYGDRFRHDPALSHPAWPSLEGLRELARAEKGSTELPFCIVHARQVRNRALHALHEANAAFETVLA